MFSEPRASSSKNPSRLPGPPINGPSLTAVKINRPPLLAKTLPPKFVKRLRLFLRSFFAGSSVAAFSPNCILYFVECLAEYPNLDSIIFDSPAKKAFPGRNRVCAELCKQIIQKLETLKMEPSDKIYKFLCDAMTNANGGIGENGHFYRIFPINFDQLCTDNYIVIREEMQQISLGTTGLSCWQSKSNIFNKKSPFLSPSWGFLAETEKPISLAMNIADTALIEILSKASFVLADFLLLVHSQNLKKFECILELGAGCGLAGIAAAKCLACKKDVVLSDFSETVLDRLQENVKMNFGVEEENVKVKHLDWTNYRVEELPAADLILAADVVYDPALFPSLAGLLRHLLHPRAGVFANPIAYFACTVRDPNTLEEFLHWIDKNGIQIRAKWEHRRNMNNAQPEELHQFVRINDAFQAEDGADKKDFTGCFEFEPIFSPPIQSEHFSQSFKTLIFEFAYC